VSADASTGKTAPAPVAAVFAFPAKARLDVAQPARAIPCGKIAGFRARADKPADAWHGG